jgi:hypothetical protein
MAGGLKQKWLKKSVNKHVLEFNCAHLRLSAANNKITSCFYFIQALYIAGGLKQKWLKKAANKRVLEFICVHLRLSAATNMSLR